MAPRFDDEEEFAFGEPEDEIEDESFDLEDEDGEFLDDEEEDEEYADDDEGNEFTDLDSVVEEGEELLEAGEYAKAIELLAGGIEAFADAPQLYYLLGLASTEALKEDMAHNELWEKDSDLVEMYEQAVSAFEEALNLEAEHLGSLNALGTLYALRGNYESAINCWEKSIEVEPDQQPVLDDIRMARRKMDD